MPEEELDAFYHVVMFKCHLRGVQCAREAGFAVQTIALSYSEVQETLSKAMCLTWHGDS